jgi:hypothetical protein
MTREGHSFQKRLEQRGGHSSFFFFFRFRVFKGYAGLTWISCFAGLWVPLFLFLHFASFVCDSVFFFLTSTLLNKTGGLVL